MSVTLTNLPPLPEGVKNGVAQRDGRTLYAGLGSAGKRFYCLNLDDLEEGWKDSVDFPGVERNDAVTVADDGGIWVFSGAGIPEDTEHAQVLTDVYYFCFETKTWQLVQTETPVGLLGASGCEIADGQFVFFGGYNKRVFDDFCQKLSQIDIASEPEIHRATLTEFMSKKPEQYAWNKEIILYDTKKNQWLTLQDNPYSANCGAGLILDGNKVILIDGEIKPGLRSTQVKQYLFAENNRITTQLLPSICQSSPEHEGLAGCYAGKLENQLIAIGGAYFVGSQNNRKKGSWYTHQGLSKHYSDVVWSFANDQWTAVEKLPIGSAYGSVINTEKELILIGGEDANQQALTSCYLVKSR